MGLISSTLDTARRVAGRLAAMRAATASLDLALAWSRGPVVRISRGNRGMLLSIPHLIYVPDIAADFDLMFNAVEPETRGKLQLVDYSHPRLHRVRGMDADMMLTSFSEGVAGVEMYFRYASVAAGDIVLDLGANCGLFSIACAKRVGPNGLVVAVEPDPLNCAALRDNLRRHGVDNVRVIQAAIWSAPGVVKFGAHASLGSLVLGDGAIARGRVIDIPATTIDAIAREVGAEKISVVKVDIEGAEYAAYAGATELLALGRATWLTEVHVHQPSRRVASELIERCFDPTRYAVTKGEQGAAHEYPLVIAAPRTA